MASLDLLGLQDTMATLERLAAPEHQVEFPLLPFSVALQSSLSAASKTDAQIDLPWIRALQASKGCSCFLFYINTSQSPGRCFLSLVTIAMGF